MAAEDSKTSQAFPKLQDTDENQGIAAKTISASMPKPVSNPTEEHSKLTKASDADKINKNVSSKADAEKVDKNLNDQGNSDKVDKSVNDKAGSDKVDKNLSYKGDSEKVDTSVNDKAASEKVDKSVNDKADSKNTMSDKGKFVPDEDEQNDDPDVSFQHGSVKHPAHEMYPHCHQIGRASCRERV